MSLPVVIVTGPMRSGTSAVAAICHRLGFFAGVSMSPPRPPRWHMDYEDQEALQALLIPVPFEDWFPAYLDKRMRQARIMINAGEWWIEGITLKSPLYAPHLMEMREAIHDATGKHPIIIVCSRAQGESDASMEASNAGLSPAHRADIRGKQAHIRAALAFSPTALHIDHSVDFDDLLANPGKCGSRIATILDRDSGEGNDHAENVIEHRPA